MCWEGGKTRGDRRKTWCKLSRCIITSLNLFGPEVASTRRLLFGIILGVLNNCLGGLFFADEEGWLRGALWAGFRHSGGFRTTPLCRG